MPRSREIHEWLDRWSEHLTDEQLQDVFSLRKRGRFEEWLDRHNHKMELLRTFGSVLGALTGVCIFLKVFGMI